MVLYIYLRNIVSKVIIRDEINFHSFLQNLYIPFEYVAKIFYYPLIEPLPIKNNLLIIVGIVISFIFFFVLLKQSNFFSLTENILFGLIFFVLFIIPTLFVRIKADDGEFNYIDCRFYLPLIGFLILIGGSLQDLKLKLNTKVVVTSFLLFSIYTIGFAFVKNKTYCNGNIFWKTETELHPNRASYWMGYGFYYYYNNNFLEAAKCAEQAIKIKPHIVDYYKKAALTYESADDLVKANEVLERSLEIEKDDPVTVTNLIKNYLKLSDIDKANDWAIKFLSIQIDNLKEKADLTSSISYYYAQAKFFPFAIKFMKEAIKIFPNNPTYNNDLGVFYLNKGVIDSARILFEIAVSENPKDVDFQKNLNYTKSKLKQSKMY